ncbi:MAG: phosphate acyltransferase PlsX [Alphaproteobacteria bacterium]|nr:phosphate acyltransferase PlsX [Alphaproteobacteria bacterium]MBV9554920.1 phosphate acyltransferase PlsX [Alphaproteobacteria bacterium]
MSGTITIALDAMGGDRAPEVVIRGADLALERHPDAQFLVFGAQERIAPLVAQLPRVAKVATLHHTSEMVQNDDKPSQALRAGRNTSMRLAIEAVAEGRADGVVSAGNTGALMAIAKFALKTLPGIDRPAIATFFPTLRGETVMLDLGANVECDAENLVQFALMGDAFARSVLGIVEPTVGLLNVGSEDLKGNDAVRGAAARLRGGLIPLRFHGFVEGDDIGAGTVDVIVTDGFTGNVALKTAEGTARLFTHALRTSFEHSPMAKIGALFARGALRKFRERLDPRRYNGAMFLGLRGIAVKSHGGTDAFGFANAIGVAIDMKVNGFLEKIRADLTRINVPMPAPQPAAL